MSEDVIETIVDGGKASAGPPLGPALGPTGINIKTVLDAINKKTEAFSGMKVPVKVIIDKKTKEFKIEVGTPSVSELVKKEINIEKGSGRAGTDMVADMRIEQIIKVAMMKQDSMGTRTLKSAVKNVVGTCVSMGIMINGKNPKDLMKDVANGIYDQKIESRKTELTAEELKAIEVEKKSLAERIKAQHEKEELVAKDIVTGMAGKPTSEIKHKLLEAGISKEVIAKLLPRAGGTEAGAGTAPAGGATATAAAPKSAASKLK